MILITGGLGFIGTHTAAALLDLGESCVLVQRRAPSPPDALAAATAGRLHVEQVDITDLHGLLEVGARHPITGIVHLAGSVPWPPGTHEPIDGARRAIDSLLNVVHAARTWNVRRVSVASTIGVYGGVDAPSPLAEDLPLPMTSGHVIPTFKKIGELLTDHLTMATDIEILIMRISAVWGPLGRPASTFFPAPQLVHAAVRAVAPDLTALREPAYGDDGHDLCYVKDCARAIALLQTTRTLNHRTYNIAGGHATTNRELVDALAAVVPGTRLDLPAGRNPDARTPDVFLDIGRLCRDTGYRPAYDTQRAVADYVDWLRAGNPQ